MAFDQIAALEWFKETSLPSGGFLVLE